jgi:hypothetical protein
MIKKFYGTVLLFLEEKLKNETVPGKKNSNIEVTYTYFLLIIVLFSLFNILLNPWSTSGEMWAEMATNYYKISQEGNAYAQLTAADHGYIPLSQRILAFLISSSGVFSDLLAYMYTWSAIFVSALLVGTFSLHHFRTLVSNDITRALISMAVLVALDWETATFINFAYLNTFFISIFVALAVQKNAEDAPFIAFFIPFLIVGKVYVLAIAPIMLIAILFVKVRYKKIFKVSLILAGLHFLYILDSYLSIQTLNNGSGTSFFSKFISSFYYFGLYNLRDLLGLEAFSLLFNSVSKGLSLIFGWLFISISIYTIYVKRSLASPLIIIGLVLSFGTYFLNSFINAPSFNINNPSVSTVLYRHVITGFIGFIFIFVGIIESWLGQNRSEMVSKYSTLVIFLSWFYLSGWLGIALQNSKPGFITSKWQVNAKLIDSANANRPCVPIDPYPWVYNYGPDHIENKIHCDYISKLTFGVGAYKSLGYDQKFHLSINDKLRHFSVKSFMFAVKSFDNSNYMLTMKLTANMLDGKTFVFVGQQEVRSYDTMLFATSMNNIFVPIDQIVSIDVELNLPALVWSDLLGVPDPSWMGVPSTSVR